MGFAGEGGGALLGSALGGRVVFCCVVFFVVGILCVAGGLVCVVPASAAHDLPQ